MKSRHRGWQRILLIIIPYILVVGVFQYLGSLVIGIDLMNPVDDKSPMQLVILSAFSLIGTLLVIWLFVRFIEKNKLITLGLNFKGQSKELNRGIAIGIMIMLLGFVSLLATNQISYQSINFNLLNIFLTIILFMIVSFSEELLLRGYVLRNLMISFNKYVALLVSSILFSLMHAFNPNVSTIGLVNIFLAGILLGITYIHTKNLWFPLGLHFSWNLFQTWLGFNVSGQDSYSILEISVNQNNLFSGGEFGFEASILASIFQCVVIVGLGIYYQRKSQVVTLD
ncbi:lysostaphin resistance A-like protein [Sunxiuqinia sp. A32]|uniref:lysostaphin resistance A-like protein n=1 Tax=Sunxiuqinia sp. A32 TaxID=3461496 RepID=UPI004045C5BD